MPPKSKLTHVQEKQQTTKPVESKITPSQQQMPLEMLVSQATLDPKSLTPANASQLQRSIGNRAVNQLVNRTNLRQTSHPPSIAISLQRMLTTRGIQAKLTVNAPGDHYEQEADTVAKQVVTTINTLDVQKPATQRQEDDEQIMTKPMIQRVENGNGGIVNDTVERDIQQARGSGQSLTDNIRGPMEQAFGADFSRVKIHTDSKSNHLNKAVQAKAFTSGQDVFFRHGEYSPASKNGQELLAHELTHVVQQEGGTIRRTIDIHGTQPYGHVIQRLTDASGVEITDEMIEAETNLATLKEWAELPGDGDWEDEATLGTIKEKIAALEPTAAAPSEEIEPAVVAEAPAAPITKNPAGKQPKRQRPPAPVKAPAPAGSVYLDQLPKGGGTNKTRTWGKSYPHVSVLMGSVNQKQKTVQIQDIHYSVGASTTHIHWISKGGGRYELKGDPNTYSPEGKVTLRIAYQKVSERGKKLGLDVVRPEGIAD